MTVIHLLHNVQIRLALSWISIRSISWLMEYNIEAIPLLVMTFVSAFLVGLFLHKKDTKGTPIENTLFTSLDTKSSRIEDDVLGNKGHTEIVISTKGVNMNQ
ncbi:MAG: hypothetical protein GPJ54_06160 [Candidatus Heimdallarchaeota archaeon]|nr:hypothetical protein [Candidatus Heimdallarchaeota archaeon]